MTVALPLRTDCDACLSTALVALRGDDLVIMATEVHSVLSPSVEVGSHID